MYTPRHSLLEAPRHDGLVDAVRWQVLGTEPSHLASTADLAAARYQLPKQINKSSAT